ncbi:nicotinamide-nucleotide amidase [Rhizomicrobium palustre]|uniref:Nicotinamide-nucleotide amidase n=1 Tax=Rhizomicrobium palustre TaxID=189966 RepID=A0A846N426_9PROT|nr:CinA family protein [Rhizomicrobium palustre]NIK89981.1 nicotinamide-nucleotide amidase [Rhizomicrobium palustre]
MFSDALIQLAATVLDEARTKGVMIATAESCTGGLIAGLLTEIPGSSDVVERGFVTYSNEAKADLLGIPLSLIQDNGAVSEVVARAMAEGAVQKSLAQVSVAVTGIAGPGGGSAEKPVGLVHMAAAREDGVTLYEEHRFGDIGRTEVRLATVEAALKLVRKQLAQP